MRDPTELLAFVGSLVRKNPRPKTRPAPGDFLAGLSRTGANFDDWGAATWRGVAHKLGIVEDDEVEAFLEDVAAYLGQPA